MLFKKFCIVFVQFVVVSTLATANTCPKWLPMPMTDGLHAVIPIYNESITGPDMDCDEILDNVDTDIDGDGISNAVESANGTNPLNTDTDGDGVSDNNDAFPLNSAETSDTDGDGIGNNADPDDDNDGHSDVSEIATGTNPLDASTYPKPFIITVKTDNYGTSENDEFIIPTHPDEDYSYYVNCHYGNGSYYLSFEITGDHKCIYNSPGIYSIAIYSYHHDGTGFPRIYFNDEKDNYKIIGINQWGTGHWTSMKRAFSKCRRLNNGGGDAVDAPDLSRVTNMNEMFAGASTFNQSIGHWDTSNITNMFSLFAAAAFNQPINNWDTSSVRDMHYMFYNADSFNQPLISWDTGNVENMSYMFGVIDIFSQDIRSWNTSNVTNMRGMFYGAKLFNGSIALWDTSSVENMNSMFEDATSFNSNLGLWETISVTDMSHMFDGATSFNLYIGSWDTDNVKNMSYMFYNASNFSSQDLSWWDVNNVTSHGNFSTGWGLGNTEPVWP